MFWRIHEQWKRPGKYACSGLDDTFEVSPNLCGGSVARDPSGLPTVGPESGKSIMQPDLYALNQDS
jgi:hypothetical protein